MTPHEDPDQVRAVLREIVAEHGPEVLSRPAVMSGLLKDSLSGTPGIARILVAAGEEHVADALRDHISVGRMDAATAARLTASSFATATFFTPEVCAWAVTEYAISLGLITHPAGPQPGAAAAFGRIPARSPDGTTAYVLNASAGAVTPIDLSTRIPGTPIVVGASPGAIAITPDGTTAYVVNANDGNVTPIDLANRTPGTPIVLGSRISGAIVITPDGTTAYVTSFGAVTPIDLATRIPGTPIVLGSRTPGPGAIVITPDGATAYVTQGGDPWDAMVTPIDLANRTPGTPINVLGSRTPGAIVITPDGTTAYVTSQMAGTVTPIDLATATLGAPIWAGKEMGAIVITPDGTTAYVTNPMAGTVTPIDLATRTSGTPIWAGRFPAAIVITRRPDVETPLSEPRLPCLPRRSRRPRGGAETFGRLVNA